MNCPKHPDCVLFINNECSWCLSLRKAQERKLFKSIPDRLLADVTGSPVAQAALLKLAAEQFIRERGRV